MSDVAYTPIRVLIIQPVVPNYRMPFFKALIQNVDFDITIFAGRRIFHGPDSSAAAAEIADLDHETLTMLRGLLQWQRNIWIPKDFRAGDILVLSGNPRLANNPLLIAQARFKKMKIVWWGQGWTAHLKPWRVVFRRQLMRLADVVILYTEKEASEYISAGFNIDRVFGLNNTIDASEIKALRCQWDVPRLDAFKCQQGLTKPFRLLFVSRITPKARLVIILQALRLLPAGQYELIVIGDGPELSSCQQTARALGIETRVRWLGGVYDERLLAPYFLSASCFVYAGAIGLSLLHAFAYGLPVVTHGTAREHMPEFAALIDGVNGLTFVSDDPRNLADKIAALCADQALLQSMRENALKVIENEFSMGHMVMTFKHALLRAATV